MSNDFKQTVDLSEQMKKRAPKRLVSRPATPEKKKVSRASAIDKVYQDNEEERADMRRINRPEPKPDHSGVYKKFVWVLGFIFIIVALYFTWRGGEEAPITEVKPKTGWYMVELANGETYYGQVADTSADPVVIENVYYNYDQLTPEGRSENMTGNLRLVKRGKETHGPDGSMSVVRAQVMFMEPLKEDSKVLKAILEYEK